MAAIFKKGPKGEVLAKVQETDGLMPIKNCFQFVDGFKINIRFFINPKTRSCYWVTDGFVTSILTEPGHLKAGMLYFSSRSGCKSVRVRYAQPVVFVVQDWLREKSPILLDKDMCHMGGSNIYGRVGDVHHSYRLCLGEAGDIMSISMLDLFFYGKANADLNWLGDAIHVEDIKYKTAAGGTKKILEAKSWTQIAKTEAQVPDKIKECLNAFSHS